VKSAFDRLKENDLIFHGGIVFLGFVAANVFNYLYYMLAGRVLGVLAYGELTALTSALLTLAAPANVLQIIIARLSAGFYATRSYESLRRLSTHTVRWTSLVALLVAAAGVLFRDPLATFFHTTSGPVLATAAALGIYLVITVQRGVLQGSHRFGELSASYVIEALARVGAGIPLALHYGAFGALLGAVIGAAVALVYNLWTIHAATRGDGVAAAFDLRHIVRVTSGIGVSQFALTVLSFYDVALVRHVFDARSAGLYAAAALVGRAMLGMLQFVPTVVMPKATARASAGSPALRVLGAGVGLSVIIAGAGALIAMFAPGELAAAFAGRAFLDAAPLVLPYVLAAGALGIANVAAAYQIGLHRYSFVIPSTIVAVAEITLNAVWHPSPLIFVIVLLGGHTAYLAATFIGIGGTLRD